MTAYNDITLEIDDPVAILRLNRPEKLNAFTFETLLEIRAAIKVAVADPRVVGIVITGNGRGFCAGLDAQALAAAHVDRAAELVDGPYLRLWPDRHATDGFFAAVWQRR